MGLFYVLVFKIISLIIHQIILVIHNWSKHSYINFHLRQRYACLFVLEHYLFFGNLGFL